MSVSFFLKTSPKFQTSKHGHVLYYLITVFFFQISLWSQSIPVTLSWTGETKGIIFSSPAIDPNGIVYVGSNDNNLTAFNTDGSIKWTFPTGNWVDSSPALSKDSGTIYVGSWDNKLYAVTCSDGSLDWSFETNSYITSSPAVDLNGRIYFGSMDSIFYALESNGSLAWEYFVGQPVFSSPAIGENGTLYFGDENGTLHAVNKDGSVKWTYRVDDVMDTNKSILSSPALDTSGNLYFGSGNGYCYSLSDDGDSASLNWKYLTADRVDSSPVLGINGEVFFVSRDGYMRSLPTFSATEDNLPNWEVFTGDVFYSSPVVDENGRVYVIGYTGGGENHLFAFDANGSKAWDSNVSSPPFEIPSVVDSSLLLSDDGKLYFGCFDKKLYCLDIGTGPANSDWPMFGRVSRRDRDWPSQTLFISVSGNSGGNVSGAGTYYQGSSVPISATADNGYSFSFWSGEGVADSNASSTTVDMLQSRNIAASFSLNSYELNVLAGIGGSVSGSGTFDHGTQPFISATPSTGYSFSSWSGEGVVDSNASTTTVDMSMDRNISASFSLNSYELNVLAGIGGSVSGSGTFNHGTQPAITASPHTGYSFSGWSGEGVNDENASSTTVDMLQNRNISASFTLNSYELNVLAGIGGSVSGSGTFDHGTQPFISATPSTGYSFSGWSGEGVNDSNASTTFVDMSTDRNISASFSLNSYELNVLAGIGGSVSGSGTFNHGTQPAITASPHTGYSFSGWSGEGIADSNASSTSVDMLQNRSVSANFVLNSYSLVVVAGTGGTTSGDGVFNHGSLVSVSAFPDVGYSFERWSGNGVSDPSSPHTSVILNSDLNITAQFLPVTPETFSLSLQPDPMGGGVVTGGGNYADEQNVSIFATPSYGYSFERWNGDQINSPTEANTSLIIESNVSLTAQFLPLDFSVQVMTVSGGEATGSGNYPFGSEVNISAEPATGYAFAYWDGNGTSDPLAQETTITVLGPLDLEAVFAPLLYNLSINISGQGIASYHGNNPFAYGTSVRIDAVASSGYAFSQWSGENIDSLTQSSTTVQIVKDQNLTAIFEPKEKSIFSLIVLQNLSQGGTVQGGGFYEEGEFVPISALPHPGYLFSHWLGSGIENPLRGQTSILLESDSLIVASFSLSDLSAFLNCESLGNQWFSSWMGTIYQTDSGWIYHAQLGWLYPQIHSSGIWLWKENIGWMWTKENTYLRNFLWIDHSQNWGYVDFEKAEGIRWFDYQTSSWMDWPH